MSIPEESIRWAIDFVARHGEGDLFPKVPEIEAVQECCDKFIRGITGRNLSNILPGASRRFIVPKDETSYRQATQLDPQDAIILSAIVYEYGQQIEDRRLPSTQVFSYRFRPTSKEGLYATRDAWNKFWTAAGSRSSMCTSILYCDIADFYNQIYHHTVENQLFESGLTNQAAKWIIRLLESTTAGVSRGVPIGPHAIHLIAEASLIPIDNSLVTNRIDFMRYADDIVVFCNSDRQAQEALFTIARVLDKQQRLTLQQHKTRFMKPRDFAEKCRSMIADRPISEEEDRILKLIRKYSGGNPYQSVSYNEIEEEDWESLSEDIIQRIILDYIECDPVDYVRLSWFYRRLSQVGHPGAIDLSIKEAPRLGPCFATICTYLASIQRIESDRWERIGSDLLKLLDSEDVKSHEYFRLSILSLFTKNPYIDHFPELAARFQKSDPSVRREIILAAKKSGAIDWVREQKEYFRAMDPWQQRAFLFCAADLPRDERRHFIRPGLFERPFEETLAKWANSPWQKSGKQRQTSDIK